MIDKINEMKMKLGIKVTLRKAGITKMDSEISMKAVNSAKRKCVEEVMDLGQGDDRLPGTDRILIDVAMVPPILMAGIKSTGYKSKRNDRTLTGATLEMEILSQCGESTLKDFKPSSMNHGKGSLVGQLVPVEYNRLTVSETVSIDDPAGGYMEIHRVQKFGKRTLNGSRRQKRHRRLLRDDDARHHPETEGIRDFGIFRNARRNNRAVGEPSVESVTILRRRDENHAKDTRSDSNTLRKNRATIEVRLVYD